MTDWVAVLEFVWQETPNVVLGDTDAELEAISISATVLRDTVTAVIVEETNAS